MANVWIKVRGGAAAIDPEDVTVEDELVNTSVGTIRELNNRYGFPLRDGRAPVLVCPDCLRRCSGDLARYWCPRDAELFYCPFCDAKYGMSLRFAVRYPDVETLPLAARYIPRSAAATREP